MRDHHPSFLNVLSVDKRERALFHNWQAADFMSA